MIHIQRPLPQKCFLDLLVERLALRLDASKFFEILECGAAGIGGVVSGDLYGERAVVERRGPGVERHQVLMLGFVLGLDLHFNFY